MRAGVLDVRAWVGEPSTPRRSNTEWFKWYRGVFSTSLRFPDRVVQRPSRIVEIAKYTRHERVQTGQMRSIVVEHGHRRPNPPQGPSQNTHDRVSPPHPLDIFPKHTDRQASASSSHRAVLHEHKVKITTDGASTSIHSRPIGTTNLFSEWPTRVGP